MDNKRCGFCNSDQINTEIDVGFDIDPSGEERQHIDTCEECGAWRFNFDRIWYETDNMKPEKLYGKWNKQGKEEWED